MTLDCAVKPVDPACLKLAAEIEAGKMDLARTLFAQHDAPTPIVKWDPLPHDMRHPLIARFDHICGELLHTDGRILQEDFDFQRFASLHDWIMLVDVETGGHDFRYLHYGKGIAEHFGRDMTGRRTSEFGGHIGVFFTALYIAVVRRKERVLSEHEPPRRIFVRTWRRLIVPLIGRDGTVARIAAINLPENELRAGLEIIPDPVFVVDEDGAVRFANPAARTLSPQVRKGGYGGQLSDRCGIEIGVTMTPLEMVETAQVDNRLCRLRVGKAIADDFVVTVSATIHSDQAFYVVMIRPVAG